MRESLTPKRMTAHAFLFLALAFTVSAQEFSGNINGVVTDIAGAVMPGVTITLRSPAVQGERTTTTDESGNYRFTLLPPGTYELTYELSGFKTIVREGVIVEVGKTYSLPATLEVATLAETVTVTGESPILDVQSATVGVNFNEATLKKLPNARDIWVVLASTPGIQTTRFDVGGATAGTQTAYRSYGLAGQNQVNLDGVITTEGTAGAGFYMDYGAFAEINISAAANSAEVASPGAFINTVIKTGGNQVRGEVYLDWEDPAFQSSNVTEKLLDGGISVGDQFTRYNDFNGNVGGPFLKDRFWWFGSYRDQFIGLRTNLNQNPVVPSSPTINPLAVGPAGADFTTRLQNYTMKFNYQLNAANSLIFTGQTGRKFQPYRGGSESGAKEYVIEATGYENSWSWVHKTQWTSLINNRTTLDVSMNNFGYHFPQVQQPGTSITPRFDSSTNARRGSYPTPNRTQRRRWHWNANLSVFQDNVLGGSHDLKMGYGFIWEDQRSTQKGAPASPGDPGHVVLVYSNGVPDEIHTTNTPFKSQNSLNQHFIFFQDRWQIGRRIKAYIGLRWDRYLNWYPTQINEGIGPFAQRLEVPAADVALFNNIAPRFSLVYDLFRTKTAIKLNWGRFYENTSHSIASDVNPVATITNRYDWNGVWPLTAARIRALPPLELGRPGSPVPVDPDLTNAYADDYTVGIEHELYRDFGLNLTFVRKVEHNLYGTINRAFAITDYAPVQAIDNGPDGVVGTADDRRVIIYERAPAARPDDLFLTNLDRGAHFSTLEFGARKRFSNRWQLITGWDWTKRNTAAPDNSFDPNVLSFSGREHYAVWSYKFLGTYLLPKGVELSLIHNAQKGEPHNRQTQFSGNARNILNPNGSVRFTNLRQGLLTLTMEPTGTYFKPTVHLTNLRLQKSLRIRDTHVLEGMVDLFNIFNANTVLGVETLSSTTANRLGISIPRFRRAQSILNPRIFRLGIRYSF
ncbi:MAG: TonB-dependent receptor [Acidobacteria bacterium]|nr:TonB-dependent receptor [Acidobacteriota bacterium]